VECVTPASGIIVTWVARVTYGYGRTLQAINRAGRLRFR